MKPIILKIDGKEMDNTVGRVIKDPWIEYLFVAPVDIRSGQTISIHDFELLIHDYELVSTE